MKSYLARRYAPTALAVLTTLGCGVASQGNLLADEPAIGASLKFVPIDADYYTGSFRMREQWDRFLTGPVVKEFLSNPAVERSLDQFNAEWKERKGLARDVRIFLENPNAVEAIKFAQELGATEVFTFADKNLSAWYEMTGDLSDQITEVASLKEEAMAERVQELAGQWLDRIDKMTLPTLMIGARCANNDLALDKINQLEALIQLGVGTMAPKLIKNFEVVDDARGYRLHWRFDGVQIEDEAWQSIPNNEIIDEEILSRIREVVSKKSVQLTIGMLDGFFVFAVSPDAATIAQLGKGQSLLDHADLQVVRDASNQLLTSVTYMSDSLSKASFNSSFKNFFSRNFSKNIGTQAELIEENPDLGDWLGDVKNDLEWLDQSIAKLLPEFKGNTTLSYLTDDGWENHFYSRTKDVLSDASQTLPALTHLGQQPLLMVNSRIQKHPEHFQLLRQIAQKAKVRFDELDSIELSERDEYAKAKQAVDLAWPYLTRLADLWENKLSPSLSGEHAIVLHGGNLASTKWHEEMPESDTPLPLPEIAGIAGIKNKELFQSGFDDLMKLLDDVVEKAREMNPDAIPAGYSIPRPNRTDVTGGEKFSYPIPEEIPVPRELIPQARYSGAYLITSYSEPQATAMSSAALPTFGKGVIDPAAKQANVSYVHFGRIFSLARPWVRFSMLESMETMDESLIPEETVEQYGYEFTAKDLLSLWSVLEKIGDISSSSAPTPQGGTHMRSVYRIQK